MFKKPKTTANPDVEAMLTDEFVEAMAGDTTSAMARLCTAALPYGVNAQDPRVIAIVKAIRDDE